MISLNILFANDDVLTQWVMTEVLEEAGFHVISACRTDEVIRLLDEASDFDILLSDLTLSDAEASFEISNHWHAAFPKRPIIYTGPDRLALRRPLRRAETFLATPFTARGLLHTIDSALDDASFLPLSPALSYDRHLIH